MKSEIIHCDIQPQIETFSLIKGFSSIGKCTSVAKIDNAIDMYHA